MAKKKNKYLSEEEIMELIKPRVERCKLDVQKVSYNAIHDFYTDYDPEYYNRSYGMYGILLNKITEHKIDNGIRVRFNYSYADIERPEHHGSVSAMFNADFVNGYHGGPRNLGNGVYTWSPVPKMEMSPWDIIVNHVRHELYWKEGNVWHLKIYKNQ